MHSLGIPYCAKAGGFKPFLALGYEGQHGGRGYDPFGYIQAALAHRGLYRLTGERAGVQEMLSHMVMLNDVTEAKPMDIAVYGGWVRPATPFSVEVRNGEPNAGLQVQHMMLLIAGETVIGPAGGDTVKTRGDDPNAFVQLWGMGYRADFIGMFRWTPTDFVAYK